MAHIAFPQHLLEISKHSLWHIGSCFVVFVFPVWTRQWSALSGDWLRVRNCLELSLAWLVLSCHLSCLLWHCLELSCIVFCLISFIVLSFVFIAWFLSCYCLGLACVCFAWAMFVLSWLGMACFLSYLVLVWLGLAWFVLDWLGLDWLGLAFVLSNLVLSWFGLDWLVSCLFLSIVFCLFILGFSSCHCLVLSFGLAWNGFSYLVIFLFNLAFLSCLLSFF